MTTERPLEITVRNRDHADAVEAKAREKVAKLEQAYGRITSCRIMIEALNRQHTKGNLFHVTIEVGVPGKQVMVDRNSGRNQAHEEVYVALRDAFHAARRRLEEIGRAQCRERGCHYV